VGLDAVRKNEKWVDSHSDASNQFASLIGLEDVSFSPWRSTQKKKPRPVSERGSPRNHRTIFFYSAVLKL
jgi:hypothetical protein